MAAKIEEHKLPFVHKGQELMATYTIQHLNHSNKPMYRVFVPNQKRGQVYIFYKVDQGKRFFTYEQNVPKKDAMARSIQLELEKLG